MTEPALGEDDLIARCFAPLAGAGGLGLMDDVALLRPAAGQDLVVTTDALVAGVHFFPDDPPGSIAAKCLAVNLSDLAAKAAEPLGFTLALALPGEWTVGWVDAFARGLGDAAAAGGCPLLGGDTVRTPGPLSVSITAFGSVPPGAMVPRTGVRPGDLLYVTGTIGDAALGLRLRLGSERVLAGLDEVHRLHLADRYLHPRPRLALRAALRADAHGGMDVSDGLVGDLRKMLRASGCTGSVDLAAVPLSPAARAATAADPALFDAAVTGGDDYEVLCAVPSDRRLAFERAAARAGVAVTAIGAAELGPGSPRFLDGTGRERTYERGSFSHF